MSIYWALALWVSGIVVGLLLAAMLGAAGKPERPNPRMTHGG